MANPTEEVFTNPHPWLPITSVASGEDQEVAPGVICYTNQIVNVCFVAAPESQTDWVLVDAGMPQSTESILDAVEEVFGSDGRPKAILLTHGHFDHVGAVVDLVERWDVPVYAHPAEHPFLTGKESYPEPKGLLEDGLISFLSPFLPNEPIQLGGNLKKLPDHGQIPFLPHWKWIHTPGHTPGHISLFREIDRCLIVGDAFVTVKQESLFRVIMQTQEISGPPKYLTMDWEAAKKSVEKLALLQPKVAVTGHGYPITGKELTEGLTNLIHYFDQVAIPHDH